MSGGYLLPCLLAPDLTGIPPTVFLSFVLAPLRAPYKLPELGVGSRPQALGRLAGVGSNCLERLPSSCRSPSKPTGIIWQRAAPRPQPRLVQQAWLLFPQKL